MVKTDKRYIAVPIAERLRDPIIEHIQHLKATYPEFVRWLQQ